MLLKHAFCTLLGILLAFFVKQGKKVPMEGLGGIIGVFGLK